MGLLRSDMRIHAWRAVRLAAAYPYMESHALAEPALEQYKKRRGSTADARFFKVSISLHVFT